MKVYGQADDLISENGIDSISMAIRLLEKIESIDKKYEQASSNLKSIYYELQEISRDISDYKQEIFFDEEITHKYGQIKATYMGKSTKYFNY